MSGERKVSDKVTRGIRVRAQSFFVPQRSSEEKSAYFFAYRIQILNEGQTTVQLTHRHWIITNAHGVQDHVQGPGVVGETPNLSPGETFEYTSGCPLDTAMGTMHGSYRMVSPDGDSFDAVVAPFTLAEPFAVN